MRTCDWKVCQESHVKCVAALVCESICGGVQSWCGMGRNVAQHKLNMKKEQFMVNGFFVPSSGRKCIHTQLCA